MSNRDTNRTQIEALYRALNAVDGVMAGYGDGARIEVVASGPFEGEHAPSRALLERLFQATPELTFEIRSLWSVPYVSGGRGIDVGLHPVGASSCPISLRSRHRSGAAARPV